MAGSRSPPNIGVNPALLGRINALAETIIDLHKTELTRHRGPLKGIEDVEVATLKWGWWFNHHCVFGPIGDIPPVECKETYYQRSSEAEAIGAVLT